MADNIEARMGGDGVLVGEFDGRVFELFGGTEGSKRWLASQLVIKRLKDDKDGSTNFRLLTATGGGTPTEIWFPPEFVNDGNTLIQALYAAGAQEG
jgi:hypothetical protein